MTNVQRLTDKLARELPAPAKGSRITYDAGLPGFGLRITAAGARAFILNYRVAGRERRYTIGAYPAWTVGAARKFAADLKARIRGGHDPLGELEAARAEPTVPDMCDRYLADHATRLRPATVKQYRAAIEGSARHAGIREWFRHDRVVDLTHDRVASFHRSLSRTAPTMANRSAAVLSRMLGLAIRWGWRTDNPARGVERNQETGRTRYLDGAELARLAAALDALPDRQAADIFRLLLLTGARKGEALAMRWADVDLVAGVWTKAASATKQRVSHRVPLSAAAVRVLAGIERDGGPWVFPGKRLAGHHRVEVKWQWAAVCKAAGLEGVRVHDLRHSFASVLVSAGLSLPVIGRLLGHTQPGTTQRYAHLADDPLRAAAERAAAVIDGRPSADVVDLQACK